jgi:hypothetical protein
MFFFLPVNSLNRVLGVCFVSVCLSRFIDEFWKLYTSCESTTIEDVVLALQVSSLLKIFLFSEWIGLFQSLIWLLLLLLLLLLSMI